MENVNVFLIEFDEDDKCFKTTVNRDVKVVEFDEYSGSISVPMIKDKCKIDTVKINEKAGYLITGSNISDAEGLNMVLITFREHCNSIIRVETDKLKCLDSVVIM